MTELALPTLSYAELRARMMTLPALVAEVPTEHARSLPLPTLRFGSPAVVAFAAPADRTGGDLRQAPPDRWWAVDAATGKLLFYALVTAVPLATEAAALQTQDIPPVALDVEEFRQRLDALFSILTIAAARFWAGHPAEHGRSVAAAIEDVVPKPVLAAYQALAADFWAWLRA